MRLVALTLVGLLLASGCDADSETPSGGSSPGSNSPAPTAQRSTLILDTREIRGSGPARLQPGDQLAHVDRGYQVYTALWTKRLYGPGNATNPRVVSLNMTIDNGGPAFSIEAHFVSDTGRQGPLTQADDCRGSRPLPASITRHVSGCLGYYIPGDAGRLVLKGGADFNYYVQVPATK